MDSLITRIFTYNKNQDLHRKIRNQQRVIDDKKAKIVETDKQMADVNTDLHEMKTQLDAHSKHVSVLHSEKNNTVSPSQANAVNRQYAYRHARFDRGE